MPRRVAAPSSACPSRPLRHAGGTGASGSSGPREAGGELRAGFKHCHRLGAPLTDGTTWPAPSAKPMTRALLMVEAGLTPDPRTTVVRGTSAPCANPR